MSHELPSGHIIYRGPSLLNGAPIVVIALVRSYNSKTGDIGQTYILPDSGERPTEALKSGSDAAVCGDCKHRPLNAGTCYVVVRQGTTKVWTAYRQGDYPDMSAYVDIVGEMLYGGMVRLGTYGDPAAVPIRVWRELTRRVRGWVGYTHQWQQPFAQSLKEFCMASVDTPVEQLEARAMGWRTFRVRTASEPLLERESICPASNEAGHKLTCSTCGACNGARGRRGHIAIVLHGNHPQLRAARFIEAREVAA